MSVTVSAEALLADVRFTPLHEAWLGERKRGLMARLGALKVARPRRVLLLNATKSLQLYPSILDFFSIVAQVHSSIRTATASYFADEIQALGPGAARNGLYRGTIAQVQGWDIATLNRFDVILAIGPSDAFIQLSEKVGLTSKLVLLDLAFYHQLIEAWGARFLSRQAPRQAIAQVNPVECYSCQPERKVRQDLEMAFDLQRFSWHAFNYIPIGFSYGDYCRASLRRFDVALLGHAGRDYSGLGPGSFGDLRLLYLGAADGVPEIERLRAELDLTLVSRTDERAYAQLLSLCRCVVLPLGAMKDNVLLSVIDSLAAGKTVITTRRPGVARLEAEGAPIVLYDHESELPPLVRTWCDTLATAAAGNFEDRVLEFARARLDIYVILERLLAEQVL
jgi:hypothetical protein